MRRPADWIQSLNQLAHQLSIAPVGVLSVAAYRQYAEYHGLKWTGPPPTTVAEDYVWKRQTGSGRTDTPAYMIADHEAFLLWFISEMNLSESEKLELQVFLTLSLTEGTEP